MLLGILSLSNNAKAKSEGSISKGGGGEHIGEPAKSPFLLAGRVQDEPTYGNLMVCKAGTRKSYHSSSGAILASCHPPLQ
jgi:hypothetical protein